MKKLNVIEWTTVAPDQTAPHHVECANVVRHAIADVHVTVNGDLFRWNGCMLFELADDIGQRLILSGGRDDWYEVGMALAQRVDQSPSGMFRADL